jgi:hypothetical protein
MPDSSMAERHPVKVRVEGSSPSRAAINRFCSRHGIITIHRIGVNGLPRCRQCSAMAVSTRRDKLKRLLVGHFGGKCLGCGYNRTHKALEFHHVDPTRKEFGLAQQGLSRSWERCVREAEKCVLVCSNCHKEIEAGIRPCPQLKGVHNGNV